MDSWLKFALVYFTAGIFILVVIYLQHKLTTKDDDSDILDILNGLDKRKKSFFELFLEKFLVPFIAISIILIGWPVVLAYKIKETFFHKSNNANEEEPEFSVKNDDLVSELSIADIEKKERINDPLGAVPDIPFGHLNKVWLSFLEKYQPGDEIWSFSAKSKDWRNEEFQQNGYVIVREGVPGDFMITGIN